jgi:hypothetical protein
MSEQQQHEAWINMCPEIRVPLIWFSTFGSSKRAIASDIAMSAVTQIVVGFTYELGILDMTRSSFIYYLHSCIWILELSIMLRCQCYEKWQVECASNVSLYMTVIYRIGLSNVLTLFRPYAPSFVSSAYTIEIIWYLLSFVYFYCR